MGSQQQFDRQVPKYRSSKDTKRWCKGVPDREHRWVFGEYKHWRDHDPPASCERCAGCGKEKRVIGGWSTSKLVFQPATGYYVSVPLLGPAF